MSASVVLASRTSSTYRKGTPRSFASLRPCWTAILSIPTTMGRRYREAWFVKRISLGIEDIRNIL